MTFTAPVFITIGDEYDKRDRLPERYKGSNMKVSGTKKGNNNDSLFQKKLLSLSEGDKYVDPGLYNRRTLLESSKKKLTPEGFKYSSPAHKNPSGMYYGTFYEKNPPKHEVEYAVVKTGEKPDPAKAHPKNFLTNPPKKGTYGYCNTTLSKGDEYRYVSDPYEGDKRKEAIASKESSKKVLGRPFKAACKRGGFFDESNHGVSKVYTLSGALPAKKMSDDRRAPLVKAWKPGGTLVNAITKFPEYVEDPYEAKEKRIREERAKNKTNAHVWKPIHTAKSLPTKAIKFNPA